MADNKATAIFDADDSRFQAATRRVDSSLARVATKFEGLGSKISGFFGAGAILAGARGLVEFGSNIQDAADAISLSTDRFQQFSFAIEQSGGTQEAFTKGMSALIQKLEAAKDGNDAAAASFQKLGISLLDIAEKSPEQILLQIADALQRSGGSGEAFAATADIIGSKVALKMVPALKAGAAGFTELADSASIASREAIATADAAGDALDKLWRHLKTTSLNAGDAILKSLSNPGQNEKLRAILDADARLRATSQAHNAGVPASLGGGLADEVKALPTVEDGPFSSRGALNAEKMKEDTKEMQEALERGQRAAKKMLSDAEEAAQLRIKAIADLNEQFPSPQGVNLGRSFFQTRAEEAREKAILDLNASSDARTGGRLSFGSSALRTGSLTTGGLSTGNLGPGGASVSPKTDPIQKTAENTAKLVEIFTRK